VQFTQGMSERHQLPEGHLLKKEHTLVHGEEFKAQRFTDDQLFIHAAIGWLPA